MSLSLHSMSVNVDRVHLLDTLRANLVKHVAAYNQAVIDYRLAHIADLQAALVLADNELTPLNKLVTAFDKPPVSYESSYVEVIEMFELSVDKTVHLASDAFRAYFKDEWTWKRSFELSNTTYATKAMTLSASFPG
jgi:hypothetical protein